MSHRPEAAVGSDCERCPERIREEIDRLSAADWRSDLINTLGDRCL
jgi:hypothetical protein